MIQMRQPWRYHHRQQLEMEAVGPPLYQIQLLAEVVEVCCQLRQIYCRQAVVKEAAAGESQMNHI